MIRKIFLIFLAAVFSASAWAADSKMPPDVKTGKAIFKATCFGCHSATVFKGYPFKNGATEDAIFNTVSNGLPPQMPAQDKLSETERHAVAKYVVWKIQGN